MTKSKGLNVNVAANSEETLLTVIKVLNSESCFGAELCMDLSSRQGSALKTSQSHDLPHQEPPYEASAEDGLFAEEVALRDGLRALVDCWMESSNVPGQGEFPRQRSLDAVVRSGPPRFRKDRLLSIVQGQNVDRTLRTESNGDLTLTFGKVRPRRSPDEIKRADKYWRAWNCAARLFAILVTSNHRFRIVRCRICAQYRYLERPRFQYKRGYTCRECKSDDAARAAMKRKRRKAKKELRDPAAAAYASWANFEEDVRNQYRDVQDYIAARLSEAGFEVKRTWVSRNLRAIRRKGQILINGKGRDEKR